MSSNLGQFDRLLRAVLGVVLFIAPLLNMPPVWSSAPYAYASMGLGVILALTALIRFCPLYRVLGISTCKL